MNDQVFETIHLKIKDAKIELLPLNKLKAHPDNRPLGANFERIEQLKNIIRQEGFDSSHPLVVRPMGEDFQIIEGEHRFRAAELLGYEVLPCVIRDLDDTESLIQLVLSNTQTESRPLEIGMNALKVVQKDSKKGYSATAYAHRLGIAESSIRRYMNASEVYQFLKERKTDTIVLEEVYKLEEIHKSPQEDWIWLHDLIVEKDLPHRQVVEITQAIKEVKTDSIAVQSLLDIPQMRQEVAEQIISTGEDTTSGQYKELIQSIKTNYDNLEEEIKLYEYNLLQDNIEEENVNLKDWFVDSLQELKNIDKQAVMETYKDALQMKRSSTMEEAERTAEYFRDKKNAEERVENERVEKELRQVKIGEWWQLGKHFLYCGNASDSGFAEKIPEQVSLAFANVPYKPEMDDHLSLAFEWDLDWLAEKAKVVAVTPALHEIQSFLKKTNMPYRWSMACWLVAKEAKNNQTISSWIYTSLFAKDRNDIKRTKDFWKIELKVGSNAKAVNEYKGSKPYDFMEYLLANLSEEGSIVIDAFAGAGTTFIVSEDTNRVCYGAELNSEYCKSIIDLWEKNTGLKAEKLN